MGKRNSVSGSSRSETEKLRVRLREAEDTLKAIRSGQVDALVVSTSEGDRVFTLRGAEQPYRLLVEAINEGAVTLLPDLTVAYSNVCFSRIVDTPLERVIGAPFDLFIAPEDRQRFRSAIADAGTAGAKVELRLLAGMWGQVPAELSFCPLPMAGAQGIAVIVNDISQRERAERELRESRNMLANVLDSIPLGIFWKDCNGIFRGANPATAQLLAFDNPDELIGKTFTELNRLGSETSARLADDRDTIEHKRPHRNIIESLDLPDGKRRWLDTSKVPLVDAEGKVSGVLGIYEDITDRRQAEQTIRLQAHQYATMLATTSDGFWRLDHTGRLLEVNDVYCRMSGYSREELLDMRMADLDAIETPERILSHIKRAQQNGFDRFESRHRRKDSSDFDVEISVSFWKETGQLLLFVRDITRRKAAEEEILVLNAELEDRVRHRTAELETVIASQPDAVLVYGPEGTVIRANPSARQYLGFDPVGLQETVILTRRRLLNGPDSFFGRRALAGETIENVEREAGGRVESVSAAPMRDTDGNILGAVVVSRNVTRLREAEAAAREAARQLQQIIDGSPAMVFVKDLEGRYLNINHAAELVTGMTADQFRGKTDYEIFDKERAETYRANDRRVLESGLPLLVEELVDLSPGPGRTFLASKFPLRNTAGETYAICGISADITRRKEAEEALRVSEEKYRSLFENSIDCIILARPDGSISAANAAACKTLGRTEEELVGGGVQSIVAGSHARFSTALGQSGLSGSFAGELAFTHRDGADIPVDVSCAGFSDKGGAVTSVIIFRDISERKQAEEAVRRSERLYRAIGESIDYGIWIASPDGRCLYISDSFLKLTGLTQDKCLNYGWTDALHPDDAGLVITAWQECIRTGQMWDRELRVRGADGQWHPVLARGLPVHDDTGAITGWAGIHLDLSSLKIAEEELRRREATLNAFFDSSPAIASLADPEFRYLKTDCITPSYFGLTRESIVGKAIGELAPAFMEQYGPMLRRVLESGKPELNVEVHSRIASRPGDTVYWRASYFPVPLPGGARGLGTVGIDISETRRVEEALRQNEELLRFSYRAAGAGAWEWDLHTNKMIWSDEIWHVFGLDTGSCDPSHEAWVNLMHPEDRPETERVLQEAVRDSAELELEYRVYDGAGKERWLMTRGRPSLGPDGRAVRYIGIAVDITARKRAERELHKRTEELESINRELEAFSYSVSHDLRAPLRTIHGFSEILQQDHVAELSDEARHCVELIAKGSLDMGRLIDDLLAFSRLGRQSIRTDSVNVRELVEHVIEDLRGAEGGRHVEITLHDLPFCEADPVLLKLVFVNLLSNAFKYTRRRAVAKIEIGVMSLAEVQSRSPLAVPPGATDPATPVYYVRDNGVGFDMRFRSKLFGVFQRLHRADEYEGTGVGLAIVQRIILRHGGNVAAEGEPDRGATFYFSVGGSPKITPENSSRALDSAQVSSKEAGS